jgi:ribosomal-protein-alanine N-acetyltransferase
VEFDCGVCVVRPWRWGDEGSLVEHANNRKVWANLRDRFPHPYTAEDARRWFEHVLERGDEANFAIAVGGRAVGGIGLMLGSDIYRLSAEVGYWVGESFWGRGIATAALRAVTRHGFEAHGLWRIFALAFADNLGSQRVLEKAGYTREGLLRCAAVKEGRVRDQVMYAIVREEMGRLGPTSPGEDP